MGRVLSRIASGYHSLKFVAQLLMVFVYITNKTVYEVDVIAMFTAGTSGLRDFALFVCSTLCPGHLAWQQWVCVKFRYIFRRVLSVSPLLSEPTTDFHL